MTYLDVLQGSAYPIHMVWDGLGGNCVFRGEPGRITAFNRGADRGAPMLVGVIIPEVFLKRCSKGNILYDWSECPGVRLHGAALLFDSLERLDPAGSRVCLPFYIAWWRITGFRNQLGQHVINRPRPVALIVQLFPSTRGHLMPLSPFNDQGNGEVPLQPFTGVCRNGTPPWID